MRGSVITNRMVFTLHRARVLGAEATSSAFGVAQCLTHAWDTVGTWQVLLNKQILKGRSQSGFNLEEG